MNLMTFKLRIAALGLALVLAGCAATPAVSSKPFTLSSPAFASGSAIPLPHCGTRGISPPLTWDNPPEGTARFVIIMDDPDARIEGHGYTWVHWVATLPAQVRSLPEGASARANYTTRPEDVTLKGEGMSSTAYAGPNALGGSPHHYYLKIYALDAAFGSPDFDDLSKSRKADDTRTYSRENFEQMFGAHILGSAEIMGTYKHH